MEDDSEDLNLPRPHGQGDASNSWRQFLSRAREVVRLATETVKLGTAITLFVAGATSPMPHEGHGLTELVAVLHAIVFHL